MCAAVEYSRAREIKQWVVTTVKIKIGIVRVAVDFVAVAHRTTAARRRRAAKANCERRSCYTRAQRRITSDGPLRSDITRPPAARAPKLEASAKPEPR
ncbi:hypothetical protein EVAR_4099_1 [Eumeta japonica]|uniref:Uncharacterized protein n=1 Tax=Eumeta variegata TaxID=151549 RepID=A0A4C1T4V6_EUMVA|nr:hypothetical protein EVAR_4099_1 [Eumeta japonica]